MDFDRLTAQQRETAFQRLDVIRAVEAKAAQEKIRLDEAARKMGLSKDKLFRWKRQMKAGGVAALADWKHKRREGKSDVSDVERAFIEEHILTQNGPKAMTVYEWVYVPWCEEHGIAAVSYSTFKRRVDEISTADKLYHIAGKKKYADAGPAMLRDWQVLDPMDLVLSDHMQTNSLCLNPSGKVVRPWLTWWMDAVSRKGVSWVISEQPNQDTINRAALLMIKQTGRVPGTVYIDNGRDYASKAFLGVTASGRKFDARYELDEPLIRGIWDRLGAEVLFALPYNAKAKHIEPNHKMLQNLERLGDYYGYVGPNILQRPERQSGVVQSGGKASSMQLDRLMKWDEFVEYYDGIVQQYNKHVNSSIGMSADDYFEQHFRRPDIPIAEDALRLMMMKADRPARVSARGVQFTSPGSRQPNYYKHPLLIEFEGKTVIYRWDPDDVDEKGTIRTLHIYDIKGRYICAAGQREKVHPLKASKAQFEAVGQEKKVRMAAVKDRAEKRKSLLDAIGY